MNLYTECLEYATLGYSRSTVAGILGYSRPHFAQYVLPRIDPDNTIPWPSRGWSRAHQEAIAEGVGQGEEWRCKLRKASANRPRVDYSRRNKEMRRLYRAGWLQREIGDRFGMWQKSVSRIVRGCK